MSASESRAEDAVRQATDEIAAALGAGVQVLKENIEKALAGYEELTGFGKQTAAALGHAADAAARGAESLHDEFYAYSKRSIACSFDAANALFRATSLPEALEVQSGFAKSAFAACADEMTKLSQVWLAAARETGEPLNARVRAWMDMVQQTRVA